MPPARTVKTHQPTSAFSAFVSVRSTKSPGVSIRRPTSRFRLPNWHTTRPHHRLRAAPRKEEPQHGMAWPQSCWR